MQPLTQKNKNTHHYDLDVFNAAFDLEWVSLLDEEAAPGILVQVPRQNNQDASWRRHAFVEAWDPILSYQRIPVLKVEGKPTLVVLLLVFQSGPVVQLW